MQVYHYVSCWVNNSDSTGGVARALTVLGAWLGHSLCSYKGAYYCIKMYNKSTTSSALESPVVPSNGNLTYSWAYIDGANVTVARVVCHTGYTMVDNNTESVFRPVNGDWQWTGPLSRVSCERGECVVCG